MTPDDRKYLQSHEWVRIEGDTATVGITDHAQDSLGDITFVELPEPGATLEQGKEFGVIESVKAASDLYAPLSGRVADVNAALEDQPELVNQDPYGRGWMLKLEGIDPAEAGSLLDAAAYEATVAEA